MHGGEHKQAVDVLGQSLSLGSVDFADTLFLRLIKQMIIAWGTEWGDLFLTTYVCTYRDLSRSGKLGMLQVSCWQIEFHLR